MNTIEIVVSSWMRVVMGMENDAVYGYTRIS